MARILRYRREGQEYRPLHLYEGVVEGRSGADDGQEVMYTNYGRFFEQSQSDPSSGDAVVGYWEDYGKLSGLAIHIKKEGPGAF